MLVMPLSSHAFLNPLDAFSVIGATSSAVNSVGHGVNAAGNLADVMDASSELTSELSPEARLSNRAERLTRRIQHLENLMLDAGYTSDEISEYLGEESRSVNGVANTIRHITKGVRLVKKVGKLGSDLSGNSEHESNEDLLLNEIIVSDKEHELNETEKKLKEDIKSRRMLLSARKYRKSLQGLPDNGENVAYEKFPIRKYVFNQAKDIVSKITPYLLSSIILVLLIRASALLLGLGDGIQYGKIIKDSLLCGFILLAYPLIVDVVLQFSDRLAVVTSIDRITKEKPATYFQYSGIGLLDHSMSETPLKHGFKIMDIPSQLEFAFRTLKEFLFSAGMFVVVVVLSVLIALGPLFLFISIMFGVPIGSSLILIGLTVLSLFPCIWNLVGALGSVAYDSNAPGFQKFATETLLLFAQLFAPFKIVQKLTGISSGVPQAAGSVMKIAKSFISNKINGSKPSGAKA